MKLNKSLLKTLLLFTCLLFAENSFARFSTDSLKVATISPNAVKVSIIDSTTDYIVQAYAAASIKALNELIAQNALNEENGHPELNSYVFSASKYLDKSFLADNVLQFAWEKETTFLSNLSDINEVLKNHNINRIGTQNKAYFGFNGTLGYVEVSKGMIVVSTLEELKKFETTRTKGGADAILQNINDLVTQTISKFGQGDIITIGRMFEYEGQSVNSINDLTDARLNSYKEAYFSTRFTTTNTTEWRSKLLADFKLSPEIVTNENVLKLNINNKIVEILDRIAKLYNNKLEIPVPPGKGAGFYNACTDPTGQFYDSKNGKSLDKTKLAEVCKLINEILSDNGYEGYFLPSVANKQGNLTDEDLDKMLASLQAIKQDAVDLDNNNLNLKDAVDAFFKEITDFYTCLKQWKTEDNAIIPKCVWYETTQPTLPIFCGIIDGLYTSATDLVDFLDFMKCFDLTGFAFNYKTCIGRFTMAKDFIKAVPALSKSGKITTMLEEAWNEIVYSFELTTCTAENQTINECQYYVGRIIPDIVGLFYGATEAKIALNIEKTVAQFASKLKLLGTFFKTRFPLGVKFTKLTKTQAYCKIVPVPLYDAVLIFSKEGEIVDLAFKDLSKGLNLLTGGPDETVLKLANDLQEKIITIATPKIAEEILTITYKGKKYSGRLFINTVLLTDIYGIIDLDDNVIPLYGIKNSQDNTPPVQYSFDVKEKEPIKNCAVCKNRQLPIQANYERLCKNMRNQGKPIDAQIESLCLSNATDIVLNTIYTYFDKKVSSETFDFFKMDINLLNGLKPLSTCLSKYNGNVHTGKKILENLNLITEDILKAWTFARDEGGGVSKNPDIRRDIDILTKINQIEANRGNKDDLKKFLPLHYSATINGGGVGCLYNALETYKYFLTNHTDEPGAVAYNKELLESANKFKGGLFGLEIIESLTYFGLSGPVKSFESKFAMPNGDEETNCRYDLNLNDKFIETKNWATPIYINKYEPGKTINQFENQFRAYLNAAETMDDFKYIWKLRGGVTEATIKTKIQTLYKGKQFIDANGDIAFDYNIFETFWNRLPLRVTLFPDMEKDDAKSEFITLVGDTSSIIYSFIQVK